MKKILMVCESFGGGVFAYLTQLSNYLSNYYDIYIAYSLRKQTPKNYKDIINKNIHLIELKNFSFKTILKSIKELKEIQTEIKPDIIHMHSSIAGAIGRIAFNSKTSRLVYTPHGYSFILMGNFVTRSFYALAEFLLGFKNCITLTCCKSEDDVASKLTRQHTFIETGLNIQEFSKLTSNLVNNGNHKINVFTIGRICKQKNPSLFNEIAKKFPSIEFIWIGDGELEKKLNAKNVNITGWKSRTDALEIANNCDVFILCSRGEAIAMSLLECMYLKKICIVSNTVGNKSVIENGINGYVCSNLKEYINVIKLILNSNSLKIREKAYYDIETRFNYDLMLKKFINFYDKI